MRIKVPAMENLYSPMYGGGLGRLGQDDTTITLPDPFSSGGALAPSFPEVPAVPIDNLTPLPTPPVLPGSDILPGYTGGGATTVSTSQGNYQIVGSTIFDPNGNVSSLSNLQGALGASPGSSSAPSLSQILSAAGTAALTATKIYNSTQPPQLIPGTNLVYNPATGQLANASGVSALTSSSLGSLMPILLVGLGLVLIMSMGGGKH